MLRKLAWLPVLLLCGTALGFEDHLQPATRGPLTSFEVSDPYYEKLHEVLLGGYDYREIQMVTLPSFMPESATIIVADEETHSTRVIHRVLARNLWYELMDAIYRTNDQSASLAPDDIRPLLKKMKPKVVTCEAEVDAETSAALRLLWVLALAQTKYGTEPDGVEDGTRFVFAYFAQDLGYRAAETHSPPSPSRLTELTTIGAELAAFACGPSSQRKAAAGRLRAAATALSAYF